MSHGTLTVSHVILSHVIYVTRLVHMRLERFICATMYYGPSCTGADLVCEYIYIHVCIYIYMSDPVCGNMFMYIYIHIHTYIDIYIHIYISIYTYTGPGM